MYLQSLEYRQLAIIPSPATVPVLVDADIIGLDRCIWITGSIDSLQLFPVLRLLQWLLDADIIGLDRCIWITGSIDSLQLRPVLQPFQCFQMLQYLQKFNVSIYTIVIYHCSICVRIWHIYYTAFTLPLSATAPVAFRCWYNRLE